ncbi:Hint domain-containing protein [Escherichia coli]|nr:Hint domain-containing protein [Escherichia coli]
MIFSAADFEVTSGANLGDPLGLVDELCLGDVYTLYDDRRALDLAVHDTTGHADHPGNRFMDRTAGHQVAAGSEVGAPGDALLLEGRLTLLAPDGDKIDLILIGHSPADGSEASLYVLPLTPIEPRVPYTLLAADPDAGEVRLTDTTPVAFTRGTKITLADGTQRTVEDLSPGDTVLTRDNGPQPVRWIGRRTMRAVGACAPVVISKGTLSNESDLIVSQNQRVFIYRRGPLRLSETPETLIKARDLVDDDTVFIRRGGFVEYFHLAFDRHEIIYAEYIPTESLLVNATNLARLPEDMARDVTSTLPSRNQQPHFGTEANRSALERLKGRKG